MTNVIYRACMSCVVAPRKFIGEFYDKIDIMGLLRTSILLVFLCLLTAAQAPAQTGEPLAFDEAARLLLSNNPQSLAAASLLEAAESRVTVSRSALYPGFSVGAAYSRAGSDAADAGNSYSYGLSGSQILFSPALGAGLKSVIAAYRKAEADYDQIKIGLLYELKSVFADLMNARETLRLSEETLKRRSENVEIIRLKYEAGRENKAALLETRSVYTTAQWQHERYKKNLRLLERKLNRLLGRAPAAKAEVAELSEPPAPPEDFGSFSGRLERHPSLRSARAGVEISQAAVERSRSGFLPEFSASGGYTWAGTDWPDTGRSWSLGARLSLPLFTSGRLSADLSAVKSEKARAEALLKNTRDEVYLDAEDSFLTWRETRLYMDVVKSSLEAANARAWILRKQYLAGQASYFEWRNIEDQLISAENQLLTARRNLAVNYAAFIKSLGE